MESISETDVGTEEKQPEEDGKPSLVYWKSQLEAYDNAARPWKKDVDAAWDEYLNEKARGNPREAMNETHFPIFWSCVRTIIPAFYSRTPVIVVEKTFKEMRDPVARLAAVLLERLGKYAVKTSAFDRSMLLAVTHFIMAEKTSVRVIFDSSVSETEKRTFYTQVQMPINGPDGHIMLQNGYFGEDGQQYNGEMQKDEEGNFYSSQLEQNIDYLKCDTEPLHYKDYRHTPNARHSGEIDWMSFDTLLTRKEVEEAFGSEAAESLTYTPVGNKNEEEQDKKIKGLPAHFATVTEIWDKKKRRVYYLSNSHNEWLHHKNNPTGDDPYKLKDFFPCAPFMLGTHGPDDLFTVPAYVQLQDHIKQVHAAFDRLRRLIVAMKKTGAFDSSKEGLAELNGVASEGQFIAISGLEEMIGPNGTLDRLIHFFPTEKIAQGANELKTVIVDFEQKIYDLWGIPDIYRGISDPNETLGAQQLKGKHMSVRFAVLQREVQRLARDVIELMCDLYLAKCPDMKLMEIMGVKFMTQQEQQIFPQALALLKNDSERCIRVDVETDSTITQNMNADIEQKNYLAKTLFEAIAATRDINPAFMPLASKVMEIAVKALQQGKQVEPELEEALDAMKQSAMNPAPPPPDPQLMKVQAQMQLQQQKGQQDAMLAQQKAQQDMQIKWATAQADMAIEQFMAQNKLYLEERKAAQGMQLEQLDAQHQQELAQLQGTLQLLQEQLKADIELKKADAKIENDKQMTEAKVGAVGKPKESGGKGGLNFHIGDMTTVNA